MLAAAQQGTLSNAIDGTLFPTFTGIPEKRKEKKGDTIPGFSDHAVRRVGMFPAPCHIPFMKNWIAPFPCVSFGECLDLQEGLPAASVGRKDGPASGPK
jgi:hypothetical protein